MIRCPNCGEENPERAVLPHVRRRRRGERTRAEGVAEDRGLELDDSIVLISRPIVD